MVDHQLRARGIKDERVLAAMERVPRELFVPDELRARAYGDAALPIGAEQTISQPYMVARICSELQLHGGEKVLDVGTGSGYQAAVLAELAGEVHSLERIPELADRARTALAAACADPGRDLATLIESWAPLASLWEICAHETIRPRDLADKPPVLIIDQLEEVFTLAEQQAPAAGSLGAEVAELFAQIGDLVENRAPGN